MADEALPTVDDVFAIHEDIVEEYDLPPGTGRPMPRIPIESVIDEASQRDDHYWRAATLLRGIANAHVFEDGNKRTGYTTARTYLAAVGKDVAPSKEQRVLVMQHFKRFDAYELAVWLETGEIDEGCLRDPYPD